MTPRQMLEVVPVQRAAQAFAIQHRVIAQRRRHAAVGVDIGEVELAARLEQAMHLAQHRVLVGRQVDHAVRHHDIEAGVLQAQLIQVLDVAEAEIDVVARKAEGFAVIVAVPAATSSCSSVMSTPTTWPVSPTICARA
jgi:hypothetical protein